MRVLVTGVEMDCELRLEVEAQLRLTLGAWSSRIRRATLYIEDVNGPKGGLDRRCTLAASVFPSGTVFAAGLGTTVQSAVRSAARRLVRRLRDDFQRRRSIHRTPARPGRHDRAGFARGDGRRRDGPRVCLKRRVHHAE